ncbi:twin-arginine translocase TatA/TatE family subunit [Streptomyces sp. J2-1]|uniref:twin-arginine translocase TatA/TatE family subunit n=1 Tax=Streptomyces corallincola TaxID=2851888 RepID=UPI001C384BDF|nr:twin-arginine translocase TatA/TatE family subunit [Streptomyces corallincola]MBV2354134.1 twin-arginine translocase TatA/TatE family subunit [Streptomyces corallincola]
MGIGELAVILLVVAVVLGFKKLPELTRSAGKAARILKSEAKALKKEDAASGTSDSPTVVPGTATRRDDPPRA